MVYLLRNNGEQTNTIIHYNTIQIPIWSNLGYSNKGNRGRHQKTKTRKRFPTFQRLSRAGPMGAPPTPICRKPKSFTQSDSRPSITFSRFRSCQWVEKGALKVDWGGKDWEEEVSLLQWKHDIFIHISISSYFSSNFPIISRKYNVGKSWKIIYWLFHAGIVNATYQFLHQGSWILIVW